ncbi:MAG: 50S ribosomal protein L21 [Clostridia bacterium]|nr:50S ribosomal protein L21 [Clostridia bacterium]
MYAIFETGGKQYKVEKGSVIFVEKLDAAEDEIITFNKVLYLDNGKKGAKIGAPYLSSTLVAAKVLKQGKDKKITVFTYKAKKNEKRKLGHRQPYTKLEIVALGSTATVNKAIKPADAEVEAEADAE